MGIGALPNSASGKRSPLFSYRSGRLARKRFVQQTAKIHSHEKETVCFLPGRVGCTNNFDLPRGTNLIRISLPRLWLPLFHCRACLSGRASATVILQCNIKIRLKLSFWLTVQCFVFPVLLRAIAGPIIANPIRNPIEWLVNPYIGTSKTVEENSVLNSFLNALD
jgi:hypothetical protein